MNATPNMLQHPLSAAFPRPSADEFQALKDSICAIGVQIPITMHDGLVIDGWSRYSAATELGLECPAVELDDTDPQDFAKSQAARRNLTTSQIAMVITAIHQWRPVGTNQHKGGSTLKVEPQKSTAELAAIAGVHVNTISRAKAVQTHAVPEVQAAVKNGEVGLPKAAAIAKLPRAEQAAALTKPRPKDHLVNPVEVEDIAFREAPPVVKDEFTELDAAHAQIQDLQAELVVARIHSADPDEQKQAATYIAELLAHIRTLESINKQLTISRDTFQNEAAHFKRNILRLEREKAREAKKAVQP